MGRWDGHEGRLDDPDFDPAKGLRILARTPYQGHKKGLCTYFESYLTVGAFVSLGVVLVMIMLGVAAVLRPSKPKMTKAEVYECGVDPVGTGWSQTYIRYYVFGLLFLIFDVEAVFIFPWAIGAEELGVFGLVAIIIFTLTLIEGLVYAMKKGVLQWE